MPATSVAQQKLMAMAYSLKKGDMDPADASDKVKELAASMTLKQLKDYASTEHEGLPQKKVQEYFYWWDTKAQQMAMASASQKRQEDDRLVQDFMDFIDGKKKKEVKEEFSAPAASVTNTPGMGNAVPASPGVKGSGDTFGATSKKKRKKNVDAYDEWRKNTLAEDGEG